jgi:AraC-like DNA-binding protein
VTASIPAIHVLHLLPLLERWGVDQAAFAAELSLSREALAQPGARLSIDVIGNIMRRARELTEEDGLGFFLGLQMRASTHGFLGFAAMTAPTVRSALELIPRFAPTLTDALGITLVTQGSTTCLRVAELTPLGDARAEITTAIMIGLWQMASAISGAALIGDTDLTISAPRAYRERFLHLTPRPIRFDAPHNQLCMETAALDTPLLMADPAAQQLATEQCRRELLALTRTLTTAETVRSALSAHGGLSLSLSDLAKRLHMSERTLKRRLMEQGTSFGALIEQVRRERAVLLLETSDLPLSEIAEQVGYTELANFTRAFRRWTGVTPHRFRRGGGGPAGGRPAGPPPARGLTA